MEIADAIVLLRDAMLVWARTLMLLTLVLIPTALTYAMFHTRNLMLGFPSGIFWAILGGYSYQQSARVWDIQYLLFFASMGMLIFCIYAMWALRKRDLDTVSDKDQTYLDEEKPRAAETVETEEGEGKADEGELEPMSPPVFSRTRALRERAKLRRLILRNKVK